MKEDKVLNFLIEDYDFSFKMQTFDKHIVGDFIGPMIAYSYWNSSGCFTIYHALQRNEWEYYYSRAFSENQKLLLEKHISDKVFTDLKFLRRKFLNIFKSDNCLLKKIIKAKIELFGEFYGIEVQRKLV